MCAHARREVAKIEASVKGLRDCSSALRKHLEDAVSALISKLTPRLRSALNIFEGASSLIQYDLTEAAFSAYMDGSSNAFVQEFLPVLAAIIAPYQVRPARTRARGNAHAHTRTPPPARKQWALQPLRMCCYCVQFTLTPPLGYVVVRRIASYVAKHLEPRIRRKRVNALGSLALDADMRALVTLFVDRTSWHVRSKFTRLLQVTSVLGVSQPAEVADIRAALSAPGAWLLSTEEVRAVLSQRTDFRAIDIDRACAALPPL
ncbi:hypothetical protein EON68_02410 [archaeon]|nr:MAG: hypothetical protein EON68_02410 [archaeon]